MYLFLFFLLFSGGSLSLALITRGVTLPFHGRIVRAFVNS
ncbi:hypothetical protein DFP94_10227 [Fontibacillus phaseoli]|uniref:Uncharacterized protein n=1 Tax=Fontibacillus phaseoli TaxID=1416533 RepID=A0A369BIR5_9BACL|nr:hypothetical protein DFP94_10227 [Fontibacillus phaseoli]